MAVSSRTEKILWGRAGATCSFLGCRRRLVGDVTRLDGNVVLGEAAHIVAQSKDGPRGEYDPPGSEMDSYENLILLCPEHHKVIDDQYHTYTTAKLLLMKEDHERWVREQLSREERFQQTYNPEKLVTETVYSTLLPVAQMPSYVFMAPCNLAESNLRSRIIYPKDTEIMLPYLIRGDSLMTFYDLREESGPFHQAVDVKSAVCYRTVDWWEDPDRCRWYVTLMNRALNKLTGRKGLNLDKEHSRYYFEPQEGGQALSVTYRSLGGRRTSRKVVWRPQFRHSGEPKSYWEHLAVGLRFHRVTRTGWCLSIRPERRFTHDGFVALASKGVGRRSTSRKAHMYNINVLTEVNFWRDFLSDGSPRIIFRLGSQNLIVETEMMSAEVSWPGVPEDSQPLAHVRYDDDLFTYAEYQAALDTELSEFAALEEDDEDWDEDTDR